MTDARSQAGSSQLDRDAPEGDDVRPAEAPTEPAEKGQSSDSAAPGSGGPESGAPSANPGSADPGDAFEDVEAAVGRLDDLVDDDGGAPDAELDEREIQEMLAAVDRLDADPIDDPETDDPEIAESNGGGGVDRVEAARKSGGYQDSTFEQTAGESPDADAPETPGPPGTQDVPGTPEPRSAGDVEASGSVSAAPEVGDAAPSTDTAPADDTAVTSEDQAASAPPGESPSGDAAPRWVRREATPTDRDPTLSEVDKALADDISNLVPDDFESIDAVLNAVFEESAAVVQSDDHGSAVVRNTMFEASESGLNDEQTDRPLADAPDDAGPADSPDASAEFAESTAAAVPEPPAEPKQPSPVAPSHVPPASSSGDDAGQSGDAQGPTHAGAPPAAAPADDPAPAASGTSPDDSPATAPPDDADNTGVINPASVLQVWRERIKPAVRPITRRARRWTFGMLKMLAWPLAVSPRGVRVAVSWLALTLVFWVPVVWVLVLFFL